MCPELSYRINPFEVLVIHPQDNRKRTLRHFPAPVKGGIIRMYIICSIRGDPKKFRCSLWEEHVTDRAVVTDFCKPPKDTIFSHWLV